MIEEIKLQAAKVFNTKPEEIKVIDRLLGGKSHYTYKFKYQNKPYIIRIIGEGGNLFVNRVEEYENLKLGEHLNLNNKTVYFDTKTGMRIATYLKGNVLTNIDTKPYLNIIAAAIKKMHNSGIVAYKEYNLVDRLNSYEANNAENSDLYFEIKNFFLEQYDKNYKNDQLVFCHNDLQKTNMLINDNQIYLLDWEYVAQNHYLYDIASYAEYNEELLEIYLERKPTKLEIRDLWFFKMYQCLQWHQLALYKDTKGLSETLKTDFKFLTNLFINLAKEYYLKIKDDY